MSTTAQIGVSLARTITTEDVQCPAGTASGDADVVCGVEGQRIHGHRDPSTIAAFCCGDYTTCPSWRKERDWAAAGEPPLSARVAQAAGERSDRRRVQQAKAERHQRAVELMTSQTDEGRKFRGRVERILRRGVAHYEAEQRVTAEQRAARRRADRAALEAIGAKRVA